jgi:hypothetical protein
MSHARNNREQNAVMNDRGLSKISVPHQAHLRIAASTIAEYLGLLHLRTGAAPQEPPRLVYVRRLKARWM